MSIDQAVERRLDELRKLGDKAAKAKKILVMAEEGKKSKLAVLMKKYAAKGFDSAVAQEREAYASDELQAIDLGIKEAMEEEARLQWLLIAAQIKCEAWRSMQANARMEAKVL